MSIELHFNESDWERVEQAWCAWWAGELQRPLVLIDGIEHVKGHGFFDDFVSNFPLDCPTDQVLDYYQSYLEAARFYGDNFPKWWLNFGPGIMAGFVGANVHCVPNTVWFSPSHQGPIGTLHLDPDPNNVWWQRIKALTSAAVERWGDQVCVGFTDLGGNLDILASLRDTQNLLLDLYDAPDEVARLSAEITRLWLHYYDELYALIAPAGRGTTPWAPIWSPGTCYMLQSDFAYMISPGMFETFVMPDLAECCDHLDHAFYHLDGKGQIPHLDRLLSLERLRGIQWIPGDGAPPPQEWLPLLKRIRDGGKLCQVYVSAEGARTIVRELGGRGFVLYVQDRMSEADAQDFLHLLEVEDRAREQPF